LPPERASEGQARQNGFQPFWEHFSPDADIGLVGLGPTKAEDLFVQLRRIST
jgi:hypothetical protein